VGSNPIVRLRISPHRKRDYVKSLTREQFALTPSQRHLVDVSRSDAPEARPRSRERGGRSAVDHAAVEVLGGGVADEPVLELPRQLAGLVVAPVAEMVGSAALDEHREEGERLATRVHGARNEIQTSLLGSLCDADQPLVLDESNCPDSRKLEGTYSFTDGRTVDSGRVVQRIC
jgi:hypothetical protein